MIQKRAARDLRDCKREIGVLTDNRCIFPAEFKRCGNKPLATPPRDASTGCCAARETHRAHARTIDNRLPSFCTKTMHDIEHTSWKSGVACDITEHRKHLNQIEQQNKALRQIAFLESHKIRGPIATILGLGQFLNTHNPTDPANIEIIEGIIHTSTDLDIIIHEVVHLINSVEKEFGIQYT